MQQLPLETEEGRLLLFWLPRRRARIDIAAEAEALVRDLGEAAYGEARRREDETSSDEIARDWGLVALAVARVSSTDAISCLVFGSATRLPRAACAARSDFAVRKPEKR